MTADPQSQLAHINIFMPKPGIVTFGRLMPVLGEFAAQLRVPLRNLSRTRAASSGNRSTKKWPTRQRFALHVRTALSPLRWDVGECRHHAVGAVEGGRRTRHLAIVVSGVMLQVVTSVLNFT
jgi:hypothetical protein